MVLVVINELVVAFKCIAGHTNSIQQLKHPYRIAQKIPQQFTPPAEIKISPEIQRSSEIEIKKPYVPPPVQYVPPMYKIAAKTAASNSQTFKVTDVTNINVKLELTKHNGDILANIEQGYDGKLLFVDPAGSAFESPQGKFGGSGVSGELYKKFCVKKSNGNLVNIQQIVVSEYLGDDNFEMVATRNGAYTTTYYIQDIMVMCAHVVSMCFNGSEKTEVIERELVKSYTHVFNSIFTFMNLNKTTKKMIDISEYFFWFVVLSGGIYSGGDHNKTIIFPNIHKYISTAFKNSNTEGIAGTMHVCIWEYNQQLFNNINAKVRDPKEDKKWLDEQQNSIVTYKKVLPKPAKQKQANPKLAKPKPPKWDNID